MTHAEKFLYPITIQETHLDSFGHVNNATYLVLFEEARWELINKNGYGIQKIKETGLGPTILDVKVRFQKELWPRDHIIIETKTTSYTKKIFKLEQKMLRGDDVCCTAEFTMALFDLKERKLVLPTPEWLAAVGYR